MCGLAGWIDFERDLTEHAATVRTMVAAMANRGPDAEAVWTGRHAALASRRLAVIDLPGSAQPMVAEHDGTVLAVLVYTGEVYNYRALRDRLTALGHRFRTAGDTEVVLRAYLEWGEHCAEHLDGMFAFAVWDPRHDTLLLARDRLGVKPLYYAPTAQGVLFGSEVKALFAHPLVEPAVDREGLAELLSYIATPGHAVYRGVRQVRAGHVLTVTRGGLRERRYWELPAHEHTDDWPTTVDTVRGLLEEAVASHLVADVPLCTLLSGGLDSSAIAALAARHGAGTRPRTFAVDFEGHTERFRQDFWHDSPDAPYAAEVAAFVGTEHRPVVLRTADLADPVTGHAALVAQDLPRPTPDMDRSLYLLLRAVRQHSTVALMGEAADELFGGYRSFTDRALVDSGNFPWVTMGFGVAPHGMGTGLLDPGLLQKTDVPGYSADRYAEAVREVPPVAGEDDREALQRRVGHLHLTRWLPLLLTRNDHLGMAVGLEIRVPYCDHRLVEYVHTIPWHLKTRDGQEKSPLRAALRGLLPESVLRRPKSPFPITQDPGYGHVLRDRLADVVADPNSPVRPLLDLPAARRLLAEDRPVHTTGWGERRNVEMALQLDAWLRHYGVRLTP
ncbi:asparagine synthetase B [Streptomyces mashuensis]|uniref:asparagine synthase (glutamine-hydrolyzing) n=1 Tax=Streptomyces mashuensis TaxID=33904 RepID=A0A919EG68_9ACTN|nr:asparagine synthase (glutamine-hydrolyzing) [Streptomyces mashuensis]GHF69229.1 asparagine synthetase B [Streptomyces mashuensis]